jgi:hypothetical protein
MPKRPLENAIRKLERLGHILRHEVGRKTKQDELELLEEAVTLQLEVQRKSLGGGKDLEKEKDHEL